MEGTKRRMRYRSSEGMEMQDTVATSTGSAQRGIVSAIFDAQSEATISIAHLRQMGVPDSAITMISRREDEAASLAEEAEQETAEGVLTGAGVGAATGAVVGLAAGVLPGIGPFIAGGALATAIGASTTGAVAGVLIGGTVGALAGAITRWGVPETEAQYYASEVDRGSTYVGVDLNQMSLSGETVIEELRRHGGRTHT
jgi:hypothetical protein